MSDYQKFLVKQKNLIRKLKNLINNKLNNNMDKVKQENTSVR